MLSALITERPLARDHRSASGAHSTELHTCTIRIRLHTLSFFCDLCVVVRFVHTRS